MSEIPEAAIDAALASNHYYSPFSMKCSCGQTFNGPDVKELARHQHAAKLTAAMPHIRAQIAEQIRGLEWTRAEVSEYMQDGVSTDYIAGRSGAISNAARIAEGSGE